MSIKTAQELKDYFLAIAQPLVDSYVSVALGVDTFKSTNADARTEVWDLLKALMLKASDKLQMDIGEPGDIIKAVGNGQCTIDEAQHLLDMYKKVREITEGPGVQGGTQFNIVIQGAEPAELPAPIKVG